MRATIKAVPVRHLARTAYRQSNPACFSSHACRVRYYAAQFLAHVDGWKQFCAELHVDPDVQLKFMIGWDNIVRTESKARELAFSPEEALWFVRMETVPVEGTTRWSGVPILWKARRN